MSVPSAELVARMTESCRRCGRPVVWAFTREGPEAVDAELAAGGNVNLVELEGELRVVLVAPAGDVERRVMHRTVCTKNPDAPAPPPGPADLGDTMLNFGKHRSKPLKAVPNGYLRWLRDFLQESLDNPDKAHLRPANAKLIEAIGATLKAKGAE